LNIFVGGLERSRRLRSRRRVTPTELRQSAAALSQNTKFRDLRTDAGAEVPALETLFVDLVKFCLTEKRRPPSSSPRMTWRPIPKPTA
jgi:hypothetical protein